MSNPLLNTLLSLCGIWAIYSFGFCELRKDAYRADLRRLRDDLFDFVASHNLDFTNMAYRHTRQAINGMLRLSNSLSPVTFILICVFCVRKPGRAEENLVQREKNRALRIKLEETWSAVIARTVSFVFLEGITGIMVRTVVQLFSAMKAVGRAKQWARASAANLLEEAYSAGSDTIESDYRYC